MNDLVYRTDKNYYPQVFLGACKYAVKEKKMPEYITDDKFFVMNLMSKVLMTKILMKNILMKKINYRMCLVFIFEVSNDSSLYIAKKKVIVLKVILLISSNFKSF